ASSWVDWGLTTEYELGGTGWEQPFGSAELTLSHRITMTGLTPGTTYHYRVRSADALGNASVSEDRTFTTPWPMDPEGAALATDTLEPLGSLDTTAAPDPSTGESPAAVDPALDAITWATTHLEYSRYSVDTDRIALAVDTRDGQRSWRAPALGWESASPEATMPTPSAPGVAVEQTTLGRTASQDGQYWRTALAQTDRDWNWQIVNFDLGTTEISSLKNVSLVWNGHGEPTEGYPTALYVWEGGAWTQVARRDAAEDISVSLDRSSVDETFCLSCHEGPAPDGVTMPAGVTDVGAGWQTDLHGWGTGQGFDGVLSAPYSRGSEAIECATCHDPHGSSSIYHVPESVNATVTPVISSGSELRSLCVSCHQGSLDDWHAACVDCHTNGHWAGWVDPPVEERLPTESSDCTQCHGHSKSWTHPATCLRCHGETELRNLNATPDQPWTYSHTF
ncbi:hypothetical protein EG835_03650, partial [bacterium]|nr:hypothetical protein [bacterium]